MAVTTAQISIIDMSDTIISGDRPSNPTEGMVWLDTSGEPPFKFYVYENGKWEKTDYESLEELDPDQYAKLIESYNSITSLDDDNKLTRYERGVVRGEVGTISGKYPRSNENMPSLSQVDSGENDGDAYAIRKEARDLGLPTTTGEYKEFGDAYNSLKSYLEGMNPKPWNTDGDSILTIDSEEWESKWQQYYVAYNYLRVKVNERRQQYTEELTDEAKKEAIRQVSSSDEYEETMLDEITVIDAPISTIGLPYFRGNHYEKKSSLVFNNDQLSYAEIDSLTTTSGKMSLEFWVKPLSIGVSDQIFISSSSIFYARLKKDGRTQFSINAQGQKMPTSVTSLQQDVFYHIAFTYDNKDAKIYINGELDNTVSINENNSTAKLRCFGVWHNSSEDYRSNVQLRDVRFWNGVKSQSEIQTFMNSDLTGAEPNLIGLWKLDEGYGNKIVDSVTGKEGTLHNIEWDKGGLMPVSIPSFSSNGTLTLNELFYGDGSYDDEFTWDSFGEATKIKRWENEDLTGEEDWEFHKSDVEGGRNLIRHSNDFTNLQTAWNATYTYQENQKIIELGVNNGTKIVTTPDQEKAPETRQLYKGISGLSLSTEYTWQAKVKNNLSDEILYIFFNGLNDEDGNPHRVYLQPNEAKHVVVTGKTRSQYDFIQVMFRSEVGKPLYSLDFTIAEDKLEKGNKATPYQPAPEDDASSGAKRVRVIDYNIEAQERSGIGTKYNGAMLENYTEGTPIYPDMQSVYDNSGSNTMWLSVPNKDSGWGFGYVPSTEEIKAYFNGWRMTSSSVGNNALVDGDETKTDSYYSVFYIDERYIRGSVGREFKFSFEAKHNNSGEANIDMYLRGMKTNTIIRVLPSNSGYSPTETLNNSWKKVTINFIMPEEAEYEENLAFAIRSNSYVSGNSDNMSVSVRNAELINIDTDTPYTGSGTKTWYPLGTNNLDDSVEAEGSIVTENDFHLRDAVVDFSRYESEDVIVLTVKDAYGGIYIEAGGMFEPNKRYQLSYKYKKIAGVLESFGGHTDSTFSNNVTYVDEKDQGKYSGYKSAYVGNDNEVHNVQVEFTTPDSINSTDRLHVQPNRSNEEEVTVEIYDYKIVELDSAPTEVSPSIKDGEIDHYRLAYKLKQPIEVSVPFDGLLELMQGENEIVLSYDIEDSAEIPEGGKIRYATNLATSQNDVRRIIPSLQKRLTNAEEVITDDSIVNTVLNSVEYEFSLEGKANVEDLGEYASRGELEDLEGVMDDKLSNAIDNLDFTPYVTQSQLEQTAQQITAKFSATGGLNLIKNSIGFAELDFWEQRGNNPPDTVSTHALDVLGFGSGFQFTAGNGYKGIQQTVNVEPGIPYTLSWYLNKLTSGSSQSYRFFIQIEENDVLKMRAPDNSNDQTNGYENFHMVYTPESEQIVVSFVAWEEVEAVLTGVMLHIGDVPLQWSLATGELYNTNIKLDINGIRVSQFDENRREVGYTLITPEEFAGYYDSEGNGIFEKIFYLNEDETVTKKIRAKEEITMGPLKIVNVNSDKYVGWALIPNFD